MNPELKQFIKSHPMVNEYELNIKNFKRQIKSLEQKIPRLKKQIEAERKEIAVRHRLEKTLGRPPHPSGEKELKALQEEMANLKERLEVEEAALIRVKEEAPQYFSDQQRHDELYQERVQILAEMINHYQQGLNFHLRTIDIDTELQNLKSVAKDWISVTPIPEANVINNANQPVTVNSGRSVYIPSMTEKISNFLGEMSRQYYVTSGQAAADAKVRQEKEAAEIKNWKEQVLAARDKIFAGSGPIEKTKMEMRKRLEGYAATAANSELQSAQWKSQPDPENWSIHYRIKASKAKADYWQEIASHAGLRFEESWSRNFEI